MGNGFLIGLSIGISVLAVWSIVQFVILPYVRVERLRKTSRTRVPEENDIWVQDKGILYVVAVTPVGVELMSMDERGTPSTWRDSWDQWRTRLTMRVVYFSGQKRTLKG